MNNGTLFTIINALIEELQNQYIEDYEIIERIEEAGIPKTIIREFWPSLFGDE